MLTLMLPTSRVRQESAHGDTLPRALGIRKAQLRVCAAQPAAQPTAAPGGCALRVQTQAPA